MPQQLCDVHPREYLHHRSGAARPRLQAPGPGARGRTGTNGGC